MKKHFGLWQIGVCLGICVAWGVAATAAAATEANTAKLVETAVSGTGAERYVAIDDLGEHATDEQGVVETLIGLLDDSDPQVVWRSARSLGDYGIEANSAAPALRKLLDGDNPVIQYHAAIALGKVGDKSEATVDALIKLVGSPDSRISRAAVSALKTLQPGPEAIHQALKKALEAKDRAVVIKALEAIVDAGPKAVPLLNEALRDPATAYLAASAVEQIGPDAAGTVPALVEALGKTKHSYLQLQILLALGHVGPAAKSATPQIINLLETSEDATVPVAAAYALGSIGAADADAPLRAALAKDNPFLSMVAAWSLAKIHPDDAQLKQQAIDKLNAGLKSDDPAIQSAAEKGLRMLEEPAAK